jgi:ubiquinone/menaquinone biosynthesis C-methylase UbiE
MTRKELQEAAGIMEEAKFWRARLLLTAAELDLFSVLEGKPMGAEQVAEKAGTHLRATRTFLDALCGQGYLVKKNGCYSNAPHATKYLVRGSPLYVGDILKHHANLWDRWAKLTEVVRTGKPAVRAGRKRTAEEMSRFINGMENMARFFAPLILPHVNLGNRHSLLDLGGGPGTYSIMLCKNYPELYATVFDLPGVIQMARKFIEREGLGGRISTQEGDYLRDPFGTSFDTVLISAIIHSLSLQKNLLLFKKSYKAMVPGGVIIIRDFFLDEDRTTPSQASLFAINMLVGTDGGNCYTESEVTALLQKAGFRRPSFSRVSKDSAILTAYKP